jgi:hypothetical protein
VPTDCFSAMFYDASPAARAQPAAEDQAAGRPPSHELAEVEVVTVALGERKPGRSGGTQGRRRSVLHRGARRKAAVLPSGRRSAEHKRGGNGMEWLGRAQAETGVKPKYSGS